MIGAVRRLFGIRGASLDQILKDYSWSQTQAGFPVGVSEFLSYSPVWQAVKMISGDVSKTRRYVYRKLPALGPEASEKDTSHPAHAIVSRYPNEAQSAKRFWNTFVFHLLFWHNSYAWIKRNPTNGRPMGLYQLRPDRTGWDKNEGVYISEIGEGADAELFRFRREDVLHCQDFQTPDGEPSLLRNARESIAVGIAAQRHSSKFFASDCLAGGILEIPANFTKKAKDTLEQGFQKKYGGNAFQTVILRDGAKFHQLQIDAERAQMHETRITQAREVANWFNLPPSKLGIPDSGGYGSRQEDNANYFHQTIDPIESEIEGELDLKLLTPQQRKSDSHFFSHDDFVKLDRKTKAEIGKIEYEMGAANPDEYRAWVGKNPRPDGNGDRFVQPNANHVPDDGGSQDEPSEAGDEANAKLSQLKQEIVATVRKESERKHEARFLRWLDGYQSDAKVVEAVDLGFDFAGFASAIKDDLANIEEVLNDV